MKFTDHIPLSNISDLKLFFALSRTPHGILDMATPLLAACLCLGDFPSLGVLLLGLFTVFAGYTAVYALNDVVDFRLDKERLKKDAFDERVNSPDLDAALIRHPMAQGLLSFTDGLAWVMGWGFAAILGAYLLNPVCLWIFLAGCLLETVYCLLFRVSPMRIFVNGIVKTLGAVAAVYAVNPEPSAIFLITLFAMLFLWEIGGQNIPNDSMDIEEDTQLNAQTVPVRFGLDFSAFTCVAALSGAFFLTLALFHLSPAHFRWDYIVIILGLGAYLLIVPAVQFYKNQSPDFAMNLFNRASYYPLALFVLVLIRLLS